MCFPCMDMFSNSIVSFFANSRMFTTNTTELDGRIDGQTNRQEFIYFAEFVKLASAHFKGFGKKNEILTHYNIEDAWPIFSTFAFRMLQNRQ